MEIHNRKARYEYEIVSTYVAGIVLTGSETKSIKHCNANISDAYCVINDGEIFMKNSYVAQYDSDKYTNHEEYRDRKLLLTKKEINKLSNDVMQPGYTIVPLKLFIQRNLIKLKIGLCRGKKLYDKRNAIKERENNVTIERIMKHY